MSFQIDNDGCYMASNIGYEKRCLFCGERLYGRSDKKYCDHGCRNNHHYMIRKNSDVLVKSINVILHHNREVMRQLNKGVKSIIKKQSLEDRNFDFDVMTGLHKTKKGTEYRIVYDYAYRLVDEDNVLMVKLV